MKRLLKRVITQNPLAAFIFRLKIREVMWVPPGHFYSPIPNLDEVRQREQRIFSIPETLPGIDLNLAEQLDYLTQFAAFYAEMPFQDEKVDGLRYYFQNNFYSYADAICLYSMLRLLRPQRLIEIGSGFSSCVTLDTNDLFLGGALECTFIEPYPKHLLAQLNKAERTRLKIIEQPLQDVPLSQFTTLQANDVLFVDSTHVSKTGSDVNYILFEILPALASGVYIHFHDIYFPFEYPREVVYQGMAWNEAYSLRAFLQYNQAFKIVCFNTYLETFHRQWFEINMPLCLKNPGGSIWLKKV